jgi:SAM-dependent methyltransferase
MDSSLKLNLGSGPVAPHGWVNIDRSPSVTLDRLPGVKRLLRSVGMLQEQQMISWPRSIKLFDLTEALPYPDSSVDAIYSSHALEHLYLDEACRLLGECRRVLREGHVLRLALPDALQIAQRFVDAPADHAAAAALEYLRELNMGPSTRPTRKQRLLSRFAGSIHRWQPSVPLVFDMARQAGFTNIQQRAFLEGACPDLHVIEHREQSFFVEALA